MSSKLLNGIESHATALRHLITAARENRVDTTAFTLTNSSQLYQIAAEDTEVLSISPGASPFSFVMHFMAIETDRSTPVMKVDAFSHFKDLPKTPPAIVKYCGPPFVLQNETSGCIKGIDEPSIHIVMSECALKEYDVKLESWCPIEASQENILELKQVKETAFLTHVYCFPDMVQMSCKPIPCTSKQNSGPGKNKSAIRAEENTANNFERNSFTRLDFCWSKENSLTFLKRGQAIRPNSKSQHQYASGN